VNTVNVKVSTVFLLDLERNAKHVDTMNWIRKWASCYYTPPSAYLLGNSNPRCQRMIKQFYDRGIDTLPPLTADGQPFQCQGHHTSHS